MDKFRKHFVLGLTFGKDAAYLLSPSTSLWKILFKPSVTMLPVWASVYYQVTDWKILSMQTTVLLREIPMEMFKCQPWKNQCSSI